MADVVDDYVIEREVALFVIHQYKTADVVRLIKARKMGLLRRMVQAGVDREAIWY